MTNDLQQKNYYERLGVSRNASTDEIKAAYREVSRVFHPDSHFFDDLLLDAGVEPSETDKIVMQLINEAYETLIDGAKRTEYDRSLPAEAKEWKQSASPSAYGEAKLRQREKILKHGSTLIVDSDEIVEAAPLEDKSVKIMSVADMIKEQRKTAELNAGFMKRLRRLLGSE